MTSSGDNISTLRQAADKLDAIANETERLLQHMTPGKWKLWGMLVMADQDGTSNVDNAVIVAQSYFRDENGKPRTFDADFIATSQRQAETRILIDRALAEHFRNLTLVADAWDARHDEALEIAKAVLKFDD